MNIPNIDLPRIVVIGCGFAGLKFSNKIDSSKYQIVLIDKNNYHTFQPLLYQVASSGLEPDSIVYPIRKIFKGKQNFYFRIADTHKIDTDQKHVETSIGEVSYDYLVIATGATSNYFGMENIEKYAMPMKSVVEALDLRSIIIQNFEEALNTNDLAAREKLMNFVVVGAGPTGIELAGALAELKAHILPADYPDLDIRRMQIHIVEASDKVLASMSVKASKKSEKYLKKKGIQVWLETFVKDFDGEVVTTNKNRFLTKTLIWAAGIEGTSPEAISIEKTKGKRILVDGFNRIKNHDVEYAVGDIAYIQSEDYPEGNPMLAGVAEQQGAQLAKNFNRLAAKKDMKPFKYKDKGSMATIGRNKAVVDLPFLTFGGLFGWLTWMFVHLMLLVDFRSRLVVFINWVWSYLRYDKGTRVIIRKFKRK
ncbi:MAG: NAD(P)/FAD-dependent oxidoreductase [Putridiphycobacter sp.]|nr:NAD(P)/FAD-dependent oxidoreductase [Putridiphycobacter sp.]